MKCVRCGKKLDHVDHHCQWCTFCGTEISGAKPESTSTTETASN